MPQISLFNWDFSQSYAVIFVEWMSATLIHQEKTFYTWDDLGEPGAF